MHSISLQNMRGTTLPRDACFKCASGLSAQRIRNAALVRQRTFTTRQRHQRNPVCMAVTAKDLRPGKSGSGGAGTRLYPAITGFPFPIGPTFARPTIRYEVVRGQVWTFEQPQKLSGTDVHVNVRMTAVKLQSGGLLIYAPIAPTRECIELVNEIGQVEHVVLTTHAYEHKLYVAPFARKFPGCQLTSTRDLLKECYLAQVWSSPGQWSLPINLPVQAFGIFPAGTLSPGETYPWSEDLDFRIFKGRVAKGNFENVGSLTEVAMFHRSSRTLLLTDSVVFVPQDAPEVVPRPQLSTAGALPWYVRFLYGGSAETKARIQEAAQRAARLPGAPRPPDDGTMRLGWQRMAILVLCLKPQNLLDPNPAFVSFGNRLTISPVVERLVFSKVPEAVADWVEDMASSWDFQRIIPCHMAAPIKATPNDLRQTFKFAYEAAGRVTAPSPLPFLGRLFGRASSQPTIPTDSANDRGFPKEDVDFLKSLSETFTKLNFTIPDKA